MAKAEQPFASETDLVAAFVECIEKQNATSKKHGRRRNAEDPSTWTIYHESCGYDLVLVEDQTGVQVGIEAKLALNLKVIDQVLPNRYSTNGPDYRAVLVPRAGTQLGLVGICQQIGIAVLTIYNTKVPYAGQRAVKPEWRVAEQLPDERVDYDYSMHNWHPWLPVERCKLPEYVPDVVGGKAAPVALTDWKIRAIKLLILLDKRGHVTRKDMAALKISPTRWTAGSYGYLLADKALKGYVACTNTPDLRAQHPVNYAQIEADYETWAAKLDKVD
jgi:hypothetical protein